MAETESTLTSTPEACSAPTPGRSANEIALDLMKFITVTTGYGKISHSGTGFSGKPQGRSAEEHAEALLELYDRCRLAVKKEE